MSRRKKDDDLRTETTTIIKDVFITMILETRVKDKNGKHPVKIRLTHKGKLQYFILVKRLSLTKEEWNKLPKAQSAKANSIKAEMQKEYGNYLNLVKKITDFEEYSHEKLIEAKKNPVNINLTEKFTQIIEEFRKEGQIRTATLYDNTLNSLQNFANKALGFEDITPQWLEKYEQESSNIISYTTISMYLRCLRAVFNKAIAEKNIKETLYPFSRDKYDKKYKIPTGEGTKIALTIQQLADIENYQPATKNIETSRDLFLLSFHLAGLNFKDMLLLKWTDIRNNEIRFIREKTKRTTRSKGKTIEISINPKAQALIDRISIDSKGLYVLPYMIPNPTPTDVVRIVKNVIRLTNKHLNKIGKELAIDGLTTYVARHTFATVLKNAGISESFISEALGHNSLKTTQTYLKSFEKEQRQKNFDLLANITDNGKV